MNILEIFSLSITAILANRMRTLLTILGIVIGVTSVILLISVVTGLKSFITKEIQGLGSNLMFVIPGKVGGARSPGGVQVNRLTMQDATNVKNKLAGQAEVSAVVQKVSTVKYLNKIDKDVTLVGVQANYPKLISVTFVKGRPFTISEESGGRRVAIIGTSAEEKLFGTNSSLGKTISVGNVKYEVIGVLEKRGSVFGIDQDNFVAIPLSAAQKQFGLDRLNTIYIEANKTEEVKLVQKKAAAVLLKRLSEDDFTIMTQEQTLSTVSQITGVLTIALGGIAAISLIVGGIGIMNIMLVSVTERTREIGLRKALGATPSNIRTQFLIEATVLAGLGGIVGIILGIVFSLIIGRFITTSVPLWSIALSFGFSTAVGIIFGVAPAIRAAKLHPIPALKY